PEPEFAIDLTDSAEEISFGLEAPATEITPEFIDLEEPLPAAEEVVEPAIDELSFGELEPEPVAGSQEQPFFGVESLGSELAVDEPSVEEIGEIDFYIGQELFDEAGEKDKALLERYPVNSELQY